MNISIIGGGHVGLTTGVGLALKDHNIVIVDNKKEKLNRIENKKPTFKNKNIKDNLDHLIENKKIRTTSSIDKAVESSKITFVAVNTPTKDGSVFLGNIKDVSKKIGIALKNIDEFHIVSCRSTVPPNTTEKIISSILEKKSGKEVGSGFGISMVPEFLREGEELKDFLNPDRIVVGSSDKKTEQLIERIYSNFNASIIKTDPKTAELSKYVSNTFLATKISFINEISRLSDEYGIDPYEVSKIFKLDNRVNEQYLNPGKPFGGNCLPKDLDGIITEGIKKGRGVPLLKSVRDTNEVQKSYLINKIEKKMQIKGSKVAILGLSFKEGTNDISNSPSIDIIRNLKYKGAKVIAYDPNAIENMKKIFHNIEYTNSPKDALNRSDACLVLNNEKEFRNIPEKYFPETTIEVVKINKGHCWGEGNV